MRETETERERERDREKGKALGLSFDPFIVPGFVGPINNISHPLTLITNMESNQQPNGSSNQANNPNEHPNQSSSQEDRPLTAEEETQYQQMRVVNSARQLSIALWIQREANRIMDQLRSQLPPRED